MLFQFSTVLLGATAAFAFSQPALQKRNISLNADGYYSHLDPGNFTIAAVQVWPYDNEDMYNTNWNATYTTLKAVSIIEEAAAAGVGLLTFPEVWFPGYPFQLVNDPTVVGKYINNSIVEGDSNWNLLVDAVKDNGIYVGIGVSERVDDLIYMAQVLWSLEGEKLIHRHKLRPSGGERRLWSDGLLHSFTVIPTPYGRIGMLECWEHFHPASTFPMQAQLEDIHIGPFPVLDPVSLKDSQTDLVAANSADVNIASLRIYAATSQVYTVTAAAGNSYIFNTAGNIVATADTNSTINWAATSVNTTAFLNKTYDINGQFGYGILNEMIESYPSYIPKQIGTFATHKNVTTATLEEYAATNTSFFSYNPYVAQDPVYYVPDN